MRDELFCGQRGMNNPLDFYSVIIEGRDAQKFAIFYSSKKTFEQSNSLGN